MDLFYSRPSWSRTIAIFFLVLCLSKYFMGPCLLAKKIFVGRLAALIVYSVLLTSSTILYFKVLQIILHWIDIYSFLTRYGT